MKRLTNIITCTLIAAMITGSMMLSGCSGREKEDITPQALSVVIGNHANSQGINFSNMKISDAVSETILANGFVSVISVDGEPDIIAADYYAVPEQYANASKSKLKDDAVKKTNTLLGELTQVRADDPEVDTLESLKLAVRTLSDLPEEMQKKILIIDTGLSTSGILDFSNNLLTADPELIVEALMDQRAIPDFSGIEVTWLQMGDTAAPQRDLTDAQRERLTEIWKGIIEATDGTFVYSGAVPVEQTVADVMPEVSVIDLPGEMPISFDSVSLTGTEAFSTPQFLSEEQVRFVPDSDEYLDADAAESVIMPIAEYLIKNTGFDLMLIGTTAGDENDAYAMDLSLRRAKAVRNTLVGMGVPSKRLNCIGMGCDDPWHIEGVGVSGDLAVQNRKVVLIDKKFAVLCFLAFLPISLFL